MASSGTKNSGDPRGSTRSTSRRSESVARRASRRDFSVLIPAYLVAQKGSTPDHTLSHRPLQKDATGPFWRFCRRKIRICTRASDPPNLARTHLRSLRFCRFVCCSAPLPAPVLLPLVLCGSWASSRSLFCVVRRLSFLAPLLPALPPAARTMLWRILPPPPSFCLLLLPLASGPLLPPSPSHHLARPPSAFSGPP